MQVGCIGAGAALVIIEEQVALADTTVEAIEQDAIGAMDLVVASGDEETLQTVNAEAINGGTTLVTIEVGNLGGQAIAGLHGSVSVFSPDGPCFSCLRTRVASGAEDSIAEANSDPTAVRILGAITGQIITQAIHRDERPVAGQVIEWPYHERSLLPVPGCTACDPAWEEPWAPTNGAGQRQLSEAIAAAERCFDQRVGLITEIGEAASWPLPYYLATLADTSEFSDVRSPPHAAGVAEDWNQAFMKGMGEALERYAAAVYRTSSFRMAHPEEISPRMPLDTCVRPSTWDPIDEAIAWIPGEDIGTGNRRWLPADLVVFPPKDAVVRPPITSGLALGNAREQAITSGLLEVLERDASMLAWYSTYDPVGLTVDDPVFDRLCSRADAEHLEISTVLLTQDVDVPIVGAFVTRADGWPRFAAGSAAGFDPSQTAIDALREALQNWMELSEMGREVASQESPRIAGYAEDPGPVEAFIDPPVQVPAGDVSSATVDSLSGLVSATEAADMTPTVAFMTPRDLRELGFVAVRVVVPEAQPLLMGTTYFGERAEAVPRSMGFSPELDREPHPFP